MKCESCNGRKRQRTRDYQVLNLRLNEIVKTIGLCDSCALPIFIIQSELKA